MAGAILQEPFPLSTTRTGAIWRHSPAYIMPEHFHGQLEFLLVVRGFARERIARQTYTAHAGQLIWHLPSVPHEMLERSSDLDLRVVHLEPELAARVTRSPPPQRRAALAANGDPTERNRPRTAHEPFSGWLHGLGSLAAGRPVVELKGTDRDALLEDCDSTFDDIFPTGDETPRLERLLTNAWRATTTDYASTRANSIVELACALLLEDPSLSRPALCRQLDVSAGYLSRCFARELGTSFVEQRSRIRLARFAALSAHERPNLLEAALNAGFGSYEQLFRTFWRFAGQGPRAYLWGGGRQSLSRVTRRELDAAGWR